ncbi:tyrosine-type recombinase/integrase [Burkholderia gladioli]|uniref:tyrosine-type recombinase/integrase n=1 Tax=Burkholderia gladioli TaxID=28095 RepID=UPI001CC4359C|nr:tyrosine-type recombinase/integrase [Burkholderia gladioli]
MATPLPTGVYLRPGSSVYQLRIGVPKELQHLTCYRDPTTGKPRADAFRGSLRTTSRDEAITKALKLLAEYRDRFDAQRAASAPPPFVKLTPALVQQLVDTARYEHLAADDNLTYYTPVREVRSILAKGLKRASTANKRALAQGNLQIARAFAERTVGSWGFRVDWSLPEGTACLVKIARAMVVAAQDAFKRRLGEPIDTPSAPVPPPAPITGQINEPPKPAAPPVTLRDVVPSWVSRNGPKQNAIGRTEKALQLFEQVVGNVPLAELTKAHGARFVDFLLAPERGWVRKTAGNYADCIKTLANVAVRVDLMDRNPFDFSFDRSAGSKARGPWTDDELQRMFSHELFSARLAEVPRWQDVDPVDGRAALLLLLHTGARIGEIAQLRREDFQTRGGLAVIRITAEAGNLKTAESERVVPVAAHLLADPWFSGWLEGIGSGTGAALPSVRGRARGPGDTLGQWFRQFRADANLPEGKLEGAHKFRHWMRSALAAHHVGEAVMDSITGHAAVGSSGRTHYTAVAPLPTMKEALDRVAYPKITAE